MLYMIHLYFHKKQDKLILSITQTYVRTFVGGALQSQQNLEDMFKLTISKMNCHIKLMRPLLCF